MRLNTCGRPVEGQAPRLRSTLLVSNREDARPALVHLTQEWQRVVRRYQDQASTRSHGPQRAEDRRVPDRMRNVAGIQLRVLRTIGLAAGTTVAATSVGLILLAKVLMHLADQFRDRYTRNRCEQG